MGYGVSTHVASWQWAMVSQLEHPGNGLWCLNLCSTLAMGYGVSTRVAPWQWAMVSQLVYVVRPLQWAMVSHLGCTTIANSF